MTEALSSLLIALAPIVAALISYLPPRGDSRLKRVSELLRERQQWAAEPADTYAGELRKQIDRRIYKQLLALHAPFTSAIIWLTFGITYPLAVLIMSMTFADFSGALWALVSVASILFLVSAGIRFTQAWISRKVLRAKLGNANCPRDE